MIMRTQLHYKTHLLCSIISQLSDMFDNIMQIYNGNGIKILLREHFLILGHF